MALSPNYEEKRNRLWRKAVWISSVLIICIIILFSVRLFTQNPIVGTWTSEDGEYTVRLHRKGTAEVLFHSPDKETAVMLKTTYQIEKDERIVTFNMTGQEIRDALTACEEEEPAEKAEKWFGSLATGFNYSIDKNILTLTEREYGSQLFFTKE